MVGKTVDYFPSSHSHSISVLSQIQYQKQSKALIGPITITFIISDILSLSPLKTRKEEKKEKGKEVKDLEYMYVLLVYFFPVIQIVSYMGYWLFCDLTRFIYPNLALLTNALKSQSSRSHSSYRKQLLCWCDMECSSFSDFLRTPIFTSHTSESQYVIGTRYKEL